MSNIKIKSDSQVGIMLTHFLDGNSLTHEEAQGLGITRLAQRMQDLKKKFIDDGQESPFRVKTFETGGKKKFVRYWMRDRGCDLDGSDWRVF